MYVCTWFGSRSNSVTLYVLLYKLWKHPLSLACISFLSDSAVLSNIVVSSNPFEHWHIGSHWLSMQNIVHGCWLTDCDIVIPPPISSSGRCYQITGRLNQIYMHKTCIWVGKIGMTLYDHPWSCHVRLHQHYIIVANLDVQAIWSSTRSFTSLDSESWVRSIGFEGQDPNSDRIR